MPKGWKTATVGELFELTRGRVISKNEIAKNPGPYPVYSSQSKDNGCIGYLATWDFEGECITWTTDGANAGTVFYRNGRYNCTNVCGVARAKDPLEVDHAFFAYQINRVAKRYVSYVGNPKLMNNVFSEIKISFPAYPEQRKIAEILRTWDEAISNMERLLENKQQLLAEYAHQQIWRSNSPRVRFGKVASLVTDRVKACECDSDLPNVELENLEPETGQIRDATPCGLLNGSSSLKTRFRSGDVLFGKLRPYLKKWALAQSDGICSTEIWVLRANDPMTTSRYLYFLIQTRPFLSAANRTSGTRMPRADWGVVSELEVPIPSLERQHAIQDALTMMDQELQLLRKLKTRWNDQKRGLMQKLLTGEWRVKVDDVEAEGA